MATCHRMVKISEKANFVNNMEEGDSHALLMETEQKFTRQFLITLNMTEQFHPIVFT